MKNTILLFIALLLFPTITRAIPQGSQYIRAQFTSENGLSQNDAHCVFQDSEGFIWIATTDGLNRYDGYRFQTYYKGKKGLTTNLIVTIQEDQEKNLWVGTSDRGVLRYNRKYDRFESLESFLPQRLADELAGGAENARYIAIDHEGAIWTYSSTAESLQRIVFDYDADQVILTERFKLDKNTSVKGLYRIGRHLVVFTNLGMSSYDFEKKQLSPIKQLKNFPFQAMTVQNDEACFFTTRLNLFYYNINTKELVKMQELPAVTNLLYRNHALWVVTRKGIARYDVDWSTMKLKRPVAVDSFNQFVCEDLILDQDDALWVGFLKEGVHLYAPKKKGFSVLRGVGNDHICRVLPVQDNLFWVGTSQTGLFLMEQNAQGEWTQRKHLFEDKQVFGLYQDKADGTVYTNINGSSLYKLHLDKDPERIYSMKNKGMRSMCEDGDYLWMVSYSTGLRRWNKKTDEILYLGIDEGLASTVARDVVLDAFGNVWVSSPQGISIVEADSKWGDKPRVVKVDHPVVQDAYCVPLYLDSHNNIWVGTLGKGLLKLSNITRNHRFVLHQYTVESGLSNDAVKAIEEDRRGFIWAATNKGLNRLDPTTHKVSLFDRYDGLQGNEFLELAACQDSKGRLFFGGVNGMNIIQPKEVHIDTTEVRPILTDFFVLNKSMDHVSPVEGEDAMVNINQVEEITLNHEEHSFTFEFSALQYQAPNKVKFEYRLLPFEKEWRTTMRGQHAAAYTNISPGRYTFELRASNEAGQMSTAVRRVQVTIVPPFWRTPWAYTVYILWVGLIVFLLYRQHIGRIHRRYQLEIVRLERRKTEEMLVTKNQFFTNICHELRTPLTLILTPIQQLLNHGIYQTDGYLTGRLRGMQNQGNRMTHLITELMNFSKLEQGTLSLHMEKHDLVTVFKKATEAFEPLCEQKKQRLEVSVEAAHISMFFDEHLMTEILNNIISNAIKYTPNNGEITCELLDEETQVRIRVNDTGQGVPEVLMPHIFERFSTDIISDGNVTTGSAGIGLFMTKHMVELHDGQINIDSQEGQGTQVEITIPKPTKRVEIIAETPEPIVETVPVQETVQAEEASAPIEEVIEQEDRKLRLLIVDDNLDMCEVLHDVFKNTYEVQLAYNGQEALEKALQHMPDMIISDVMMPVMDGLQLCDTIKKDVRLSHIPVLLLSAKAEVEDKTQGYRVEADAYCTKPFNQEELVAMVESLLANRRRLAKRFSENMVDFAPAEVTHNEVDENYVQRIIDEIEVNMHDANYNVEILAETLGTTKYLLNKKLQALVNMTAASFMRKYKLKHAKELLEAGEMTVSEISYKVGFSNPKNFRDSFKKEYGALPSHFKK